MLQGYGGPFSDKHVSENSSILDKLMSCDINLVDRGFNIQDSVTLQCPDILIPAFTKKSLSYLHLTLKAQEKLHVRIHVEGVIGLLCEIQQNKS